MTKKDYKAIADILAGHRNYSPRQENEAITQEIEIIVSDLCLYFREDNNRFDEVKFRKAVFGE